MQNFLSFEMDTFKITDSYGNCTGLSPGKPPMFRKWAKLLFSNVEFLREAKTGASH